jgi:hypothetical protein
MQLDLEKHPYEVEVAGATVARYSSLEAAARSAIFLSIHWPDGSRRTAVHVCVREPKHLYSKADCMVIANTADYISQRRMDASRVGSRI